MKLFSNVLSDKLLEAICLDRLERLPLNVWGSSLLAWPEGIMVGVKGNCAFTHVTQKLAEQVMQELSPNFPEFKSFHCQHYIWTEGAAISWHQDGHHTFGATVYLDHEWHVDYGGLFVWEQEKDLKVLCPKHNTMMVNLMGVGHMVTPVTSAAPTPRHTLQIWGNA